MGFIEKYAYKKLYKKAAMVSRDVKIPQSELIKKVAILWQPSEAEAYNYLQNHFSQKQIILRNMCVDIHNKEKGKTTNVITSKDLNWMGLPSTESCESFINTEFDLLLNIALVQTLPLTFITALSRAKFKIGWSPVDNNYFDLNIKIGTKQDALYLAEQQIFYLSQLNKITSI